MQRMWWALAAAVVGCAGENPGDTDPNVDTSPAVPPVTCTLGFADTPEQVLLPTLGEDLLAAHGGAFTEVRRDAPGGHVVMDLNTDGVLDLLVLAGDGGQWTAFLGQDGGLGFATAADWNVPSTSGPPISQLTGDVPCSAGSSDRLVWFVDDLSSDGRADLVVTDRCDAPDDPTWRRHQGDGRGFNDAPTLFAVPPRYGAQITGWEGESPARYRIGDVDGDGLQDLVVTNETAGSKRLGTREWYVHLNDGGRFQSDQVFWTLPEDDELGPLRDLFGQSTCGDDPPHWQALDVDDTPGVEIVQLGTCEDLSVVRYWPSDGARFTPAAVTQALPDGWSARRLWDCKDESRPTEIVDVDGDGDLDLLGAEACGGGDWSWAERRLDTYTRGGKAWQLPALDVPVAALSGTQACGAGRQTHLVRDTTGDGIVDLLMLAACADPAVGTDHWNLYRGGCID